MKICASCKQHYSQPEWQCPHCAWIPDQQGIFTILAPHLIQQNSADSAETMYEAENFAQLAQLESGHFWFEARNQLILWALQKYASSIDNILEIGCGTGFVLSQIRQTYPDANLYAGDVFTEGLEFAAERVPECQFLQIDAREMPFASEFDIIGMFDVIEHIADDEQVLAQLYQSIKPNGLIILTVPQHPFLWSYHDEQAQHKRRYQRSELETKARQVNLEVIYSTSFVSLLLPMMILKRNEDTSSIDKDNWHQHLLKINPVINRLAKTILTIEQFFIRQGLSFPVGGSRLVVLKRN